jgi:hypothetical protein
MITFSMIGSIDRIHATCIHKKIEMKDSYIIHSTGKIKVDIDTKTTFTIEGDRLQGEKLIRDIAVLALDQLYYPVTMEEVNLPGSSDNIET